MFLDFKTSLLIRWSGGDIGRATLYDDGGTFTHDDLNRLISRADAAGGSETYTYDAQGTLVRRTSHDGSSTVYVGGMYEEDFSAAGAVTGVTKYYAIGGQTVAVRQAPDASGTQAGTLLYLLHDHLGSTTTVLDASGAVLATQFYWPYGAPRPQQGGTPITQTDKLYTGQRQEAAADSALGLYNYKARFYSTVLGEFLSADTTDDGLNRYGYVGGNPIARNDPTGHRWCETDTCDPASSKDMNNYSHNTPVCNTACQLVGAWQAFHPGQCRGCAAAAPVPSASDLIAAWNAFHPKVTALPTFQNDAPLDGGGRSLASLVGGQLCVAGQGAGGCGSGGILSDAGSGKVQAVGSVSGPYCFCLGFRGVAVTSSLAYGNSGTDAIKGPSGWISVCAGEVIFGCFGGGGNSSGGFVSSAVGVGMPVMLFGLAPVPLPISISAGASYTDTFSAAWDGATGWCC